ncbi:MAG: hypothetical protein AB1779_11980, partial [Candidatus Thermoplasmatota archaeon]
MIWNRIGVLLFFILLFSTLLFIGQMNSAEEIKLYTDPKGDVVNEFMEPVNEPDIDLIEGYAWDNTSTLSMKLKVLGNIAISNDVMYMLNVTNKNVSINYSVVYQGNTATFYYEDLSSRPLEYEISSSTLVVHIPKSYMEQGNSLAIFHGALKRPAPYSFRYDESPLCLYTMQSQDEVKPNPNFKLEASPKEQTTFQGGYATYNILLKPLYGFDKTVKLSLTNQPNGVTFSFVPEDITISEPTSTLTIYTTNSTQKGNYTLTIKGEGGGIINTSSVKLNIKPKPDFNIEVEPKKQTIFINEKANYTIELIPINDFSSSVSLSLDCYIEGCNYKFEPDTINILNQSSKLTISTSSLTPEGNYTLVIVGIGEGIKRNATAYIEIKSLPTKKDFIIDVLPKLQTINIGEEANYTITIIPINEFNGTVNLYIDELPQGVTNVFMPDKITKERSSKLTIYTNKSALPGEYKNIIIGESNDLLHETNITLILIKKTETKLVKLSISEIKITPGNVVQNGTLLNISLLIENIGEVVAYDIIVKFYL